MRQLICIYLQKEIEETAYSSPSAVTEIAIGTDVLKSTFSLINVSFPSAHRIKVSKGGHKLQWVGFLYREEIHQI